MDLSQSPTITFQSLVKLARTSGLALFVALSLAIPVQAHQPVALTSATSNAASSPILVDGTISFAVNATFTAKSLSRTFRFYLAEGEMLDLQFLIPDQRPENQLSTSNLAQVSFTSPQGKTITMKNNERTPFYEPFSKKKYLYLSRLSAAGEVGTYTVTIRAKRPGSVVVAVGTREIRGDVLSVGKGQGQCPLPLKPGSEIPISVANQFIGMTERSAVACSSANGWSSRTISRDGEEFPVTMDYRMDRLNFTIMSDRVTKVSVG